ncbi:MAG: hypothetical protein FE78DRAFT_120904, partial [Acidomyces sp. 'richmondensis']
DDDDDPVTAEYTVYLTPSTSTTTSQILLVQYPNRARPHPYNHAHGSCPTAARLKPCAPGQHLELDIPLNTTMNFNKHAALLWGDALQTARDNFTSAEVAGRVMGTMTLGGRVVGGEEEQMGESQQQAGPKYFVGAFRGEELHLTRVDGTVQMRPQFHHVDAEEQRNRLAASRAAAALEATGADGVRPGGDPRAILMKHKSGREESARERLEDRTRAQLHAAEAQPWVQLDYVDEDMDEAYTRFRERMFMRDTQACARLESGMQGEDYLDAVSRPRRESPSRRRKRAKGKKYMDDRDGDRREGLEGTAE